MTNPWLWKTGPLGQLEKRHLPCSSTSRRRSFSTEVGVFLKTNPSLKGQRPDRSLNNFCFSQWEPLLVRARGTGEADGTLFKGFRSSPLPSIMSKDHERYIAQELDLSNFLSQSLSADLVCSQSSISPFLLSKAHPFSCSCALRTIPLYTLRKSFFFAPLLPYGYGISPFLQDEPQEPMRLIEQALKAKKNHRTGTKRKYQNS